MSKMVLDMGILRLKDEEELEGKDELRVRREISGNEFEVLVCGNPSSYVS